ncbi:CHAT domain-containing protein [Scytonema hofmannii FACHB-248]|uniref:CHAT domain-containing protein n=2 Tax=Scytonema hofmannii TaxID=34078 RepID=A0ABR8GKN4_9CYAN|nr:MULTISPECIES: CHAT domain-containing protein [Nostocales]MBD2603715.1 CHAT domain-containing protein [Scytonema hofmannii FACHB-248]
MLKVIILTFAQIGVVTSTFILTADAASKPQIPIEISQEIQQSGNGKQLLQQGLKLYQTEQFSPAVEILQQAVQAFKSQGDGLNQAFALNYLALAYQQQGDLSQASKAIAESLLLLSKNQRNSPEYFSVHAQAFNTQGQIQLAQGQSNKALASWEKATVIYSRNNDNAGKIGSQINQAQALQTLGLYRRALITLDQVNQQLQQQPDSLLKANGLLSLGNALRVVGVLDQNRETTSINSLGTGQAILQRLEEKDSKTMQFSRVGSLQALEQSLIVAQKLNSPELVAQIQLNLGNTAQALRNTTEDKENYTTLALQYYQKAAATAVSPTTQLQAQLNQLRLSTQTNKPIPSQVSWRQIQSQLATLAPSRKIIYARINLTQSLTCLKLKTVPNATVTNLPCLSPDIQEKLAQTSDKSKTTPIISAETSEAPEWLEIAQIAKTAVDQAKNLGDKRAEAYALGTLGGIYEQTNQLAIAQTQTQQALAIAESIEAADIGYRWQWQLGRILNARGEKEGAIAAYTKAVDNLKSIRGDLVTINPDVQYSFKQGVEPVFRQLVSLLLESKEPSQDNLKSARNVIESLRLAELDNYFRLACINAQPVEIDKVDRTAAVIYPVILSDRLELIVSLPSDSSNQKAKQTFIHRTKNLTKDEVKKTVDQLRQNLETRSTNEFKKQSQEVYNWIIAPIASELEKHKIENLVFVLDDPLGNIPMSALYDGKQYLIEKYNVAITPGLELLNPKPLARKGLRIIAGGLTEASKNFPALPNVQVELDAIKSKVTDTRVLLNRQFTKNAIEDAVQSLSVPVVHLATHGQFSSKAEDTFILTYSDQVINVRDLNGLLQSRETKQRGAVELLVLSACSTATGDTRSDLGIAGVAVRSGARSTLASLWTVDDEGTSILMSEFYTQLKKGNITKAKAIRNAQVSLLKNPLYEHPYYWAPFVLVGNWL